MMILTIRNITTAVSTTTGVTQTSLPESELEGKNKIKDEYWIPSIHNAT